MTHIGSDISTDVSDQYLKVPVGKSVTFSTQSPQTTIIPSNPDRISITSEIIPGLYVGDIGSSCKDNIRQLKINVVIVVCSHVPKKVKGVKYYHVSARNTESETMDNFFRGVNSIISQTLLAKKRILIYCRNGQSRSVTLCAAYLISWKGMSNIYAVNFIKQQHRIANPNTSFKFQLAQYYEYVVSCCTTVVNVPCGYVPTVMYDPISNQNVMVNVPYGYTTIVSHNGGYFQ
jgi:atypical dual specificity phosphatase